MATKYAAGTDGNFSSATYFATSAGGTGSAAAAAGDEIIFERGGVSITSGHNATALTGGSRLLALRFWGGEEGWKGNLGTSGSPCNVDATTLEISNMSGNLYFSGDYATSGSGSVMVKGQAPLGNVQFTASIIYNFEQRNGNTTIGTTSDLYNRFDVFGGYVKIEAALSRFTSLAVWGGTVEADTLPLTGRFYGGKTILKNSRGTSQTGSGGTNQLDYAVLGGNLDYRGTENIRTFEYQGGILDLSKNRTNGLKIGTDTDGSTAGTCTLGPSGSDAEYIDISTSGSSPTATNTTFRGTGPNVRRGDSSNTSSGFGGSSGFGA